MTILSNLSPKAYLSAMREHMQGHFAFGIERFTGFFFGPCFYVTYHSGYEWDHKYTNQKNAAMGYVKRTENGCAVRFIRFRGALCPFQFIPILLTMLVCSMFINGVGNGPDIPTRLAIGAAATVFTAPIITLFECMTERSAEGRRVLLSFLQSPADPYANYRNIP